MKNKTSEITKILKDWNEGDADAEERLIPYVYDELKSQARRLMFRERSNHTLQPTALVHEAFIKLGKQSGIVWKDRSHFYGIAARLMRQVLVDHARLHASKKRGENVFHLSIDDIDVSIEERANLIVALDEVLKDIYEMDEVQAKIVEMKFFGGLKQSEIAEVLEISERSVSRKWKAARLWMKKELNRDR